jgi:hypothetical protein
MSGACLDLVMVDLQHLIIFVEVPNQTVGYQNHSVGCYHFGRPLLCVCVCVCVCVYTAHSSSADTRYCLLCMRASSDPPRRLPAPHLRRNTNQHFNTFSVLLRRLPFQVFCAQPIRRLQIPIPLL